jgi:hypothetical protein
LTIDYQYRDVGYVQYLAAVVVISAIVAALAAFGPRPLEYGVTWAHRVGWILLECDMIVWGFITAT